MQPVPASTPSRSRFPRFSILLALLALSAVFVAVLATCCSKSHDAKLELTDEAAAKVDTELRRSAVRCVEEGRGDEKLPVLVRVSESTTREKLEAAGMRVDSIVGDVAAGSFAARDLAKVAAVDGVIHLQLARELEIK
jgi:hypothetical protein